MKRTWLNATANHASVGVLLLASACVPDARPAGIAQKESATLPTWTCTPDDPVSEPLCAAPSAAATCSTNVSSICDLRKVMLNPSGATCVRLEPGEYTVTAADITGEGIVGGCGSTPQQLENDVALFRVKGSSSGADRTFDFTGVTIKVPVELLSEAENATRGETRLLKNEQGATVW